MPEQELPNPKDFKSNWMWLLGLILTVFGGALNHFIEGSNPPDCSKVLMQMMEKVETANRDHVNDLKEEIKKDAEVQRLQGIIDNANLKVKKEIISPTKTILKHDTN